MYSNDEFISIIKRRLSESRFVHSMNVAKAAADLAKKYGADEEKAAVEMEAFFNQNL